MVSRLNGCCDIELFLQKLCSVTPGPGTRSGQSLSFIQVFLDCSYVHFYSQGQIQKRDRTSLCEAPMGVFSVIVLCLLFCCVLQVEKVVETGTWGPGVLWMTSSFHPASAAYLCKQAKSLSLALASDFVNCVQFSSSQISETYLSLCKVRNKK